MKDISLHLLDIMQNSISAKASRIAVYIKTNIENGMLQIIVEDNGVGMDKELVNRVTDPFTTTRTTRKVGLGIPLLKASAERAEGGFWIDSSLGIGTKVYATFKVNNIDRPPLGDIAETIKSVIMSRPDIELQLDLGNENDNFNLKTFEIKEKLGSVPITEYEVLNWISDYINDSIKVIFGGVLNEIDSSTGRDQEEDSR